jgi:hypothetical protein
MQGDGRGVRPRHAGGSSLRRRRPGDDRPRLLAGAGPRDARAAVRRVACRSALASRRVPGGGAGERDGRRYRPVAPLPCGGWVVVALLPRRAVWFGDADPRPSRLGSRRSLPRRAGRGHLRAAERRARARRAALALPGRLLRLDPAARRHPPRAHDVPRDIGLHSPADERHRLRLAPRLRRRVRRGEAVPLRLRQRRVYEETASPEAP